MKPGFGLKRYIISIILISIYGVINAGTFYWVGGTGNWSGYSSHWATSSGGSTFHTGVPQSTDTVYFDSNSFTGPGQVVTIDQPNVYCSDMIWTGASNSPGLSGPTADTLHVYGSLTFVHGITIGFTGQLYFESTSTGRTITSAGNSFLNSVTFNGIGGSWTLSDSLTTVGWVILNYGSLNTNNQDINADRFYSSNSNTRALNLGSSSLFLSDSTTAWQISSSGITFNAGTSNVYITNNGAAKTPAFSVSSNLSYYNITFTGPSTTYGYLTGSGGNFHNVSFYSTGEINGSNNNFNKVTFNENGIITNSCTYDTLNFTGGYDYTLNSGTLQTVYYSFAASGNCGSFVNIHSSTAGSQSTILLASGNYSGAYMILKDIKASGAGTFTATNSIDLGNNSGSTIIAPLARNLYWVGNSGNWTDGSHWASSSGGAPTNCAPSIYDNVFFDHNSFTTPGQTVTINSGLAFCADINWTGSLNAPAFTLGASATLRVYGSLTFIQAMSLNFAGPISFESNSTGKTIASAGQQFGNNVSFNGAGGSWTLIDSLNTLGAVYLNSGTLTTNNQNIDATNFYSTLSNIRTLNMGSSNFYLSGTSTVWNILSTGLTLNAGTSSISITNNTYTGTLGFSGGSLNYYNVAFTGPSATGASLSNSGGTFNNVSFASAGTISGSGNTFNNLFFLANGTITSSDTVVNLTFSPGYTYSISYSYRITVRGNFSATGNCSGYITINSSYAGNPAYISQSSGTVNSAYLILKDINATGGAAFNAANSLNLGDNTGWNITTISPSTFYWINNSGNWNDGNHWSLTSGGIASSCIPTPVDNVVFDINSFTSINDTVKVSTSLATCANMTWNGVINTPTFYAPASATLKIYGSLQLVQGMNYSFAGPVNFEATTTGKTIGSGNKTFLNSVNFNGVGGGWGLTDSLTTTGTINLNNGVLTTNNQDVNAYIFSSTGSSIPRTLNMGSSNFFLSSGGGYAWNVDFYTGGLVINAGTSNIFLTAATSVPGFYSYNGASGTPTYYNLMFTGTSGNSGNISGSSCVFNNVSFASNASINANNTYSNLTFLGNASIYYGSSILGNLTLASGYTYLLEYGATQTIGGSLLVTGSNCASYTTISSTNSGTPATITRTSGAETLSYLALKDITISGSTFTANNSVDLGDNTGWIINTPTPTTLYWVSNGGNWNDGNHWSLTSGGTASGCIPSSKTNVVFDSLSFTQSTQTVNINIAAAYCNNMTWTGVTNVPKLSGTSASTLNIFGSLTLAQGMLLNFSGPVVFASTSSGNNITSAGHAFNYTVMFNGIGGGWSLVDSLSAVSTLYLYNGTLNTNNLDITAGGFYSIGSGTRTLNMGSSNFFITGSQWYITGTGFSVAAGTSNIYMTYNGIGGNVYFYGNAHIFNNITFTGLLVNAGYLEDAGNTFNSVTFLGNGYIVGSNTYNNLIFSPGYKYTLASATTQTITGNLSANGSCGANITMIASTAGSAATFSKTSGTVAIFYVMMQDITATGGATFVATNSASLGNVTGWTITTLGSRNLYWVGNSGNWTDPNHWSTSSGGSPTCFPPQKIDNVFFDVNSFTLPLQTVTVNSSQASCTNMTWAGASNYPIFSGTSSNTLNIYGSLALTQGMTVTFAGPVNFLATSTGNTIKSANHSFYNTITFNGVGGGWTLSDSLTTTSGLSLTNGTLSTNNNDVNVGYFLSTTTTTRVLNMGSSNFYLTSYYSYPPEVWDAGGTGITINAGTSNIICTTSNAPGITYFYGRSLTYYNLSFTGSNVSINLQNNNSINNASFYPPTGIQGTNTFNNAVFYGNATIYAANSYNNITFSPGGFYTLASGANQTISGNLNISGSAGALVKIQSTTTGNQAIFLKTSGNVCADYVTLKDNSATGGATFIAGPNSQNLGNNSGWTFLSSPIIPTISVAASPAGPICTGTSVTFTATTTNGGSSPVYNFKVNGVSKQNGSSNTFATSTLNNNDSIICVLTSNAACASITSANSSVVYMTVGATPVSAGLSFLPDTICTGGSSSLIANYSGGAGTASFQWLYDSAGTWKTVTNNLPTGANYSFAGDTLNVNGITLLGSLLYESVITFTGAGCSSVTTPQGPLVVNPGLSIQHQPVSTSAVCSGSNFVHSFNVSAINGTGSYTYLWQYYNGVNWVLPSNGLPTGATYSGLTANTMDVSGITNSGQYLYRCRVAGGLGACDTAYSHSVTVTVAPMDSLTIQSVNPTTICTGGSDTISVLPSNSQYLVQAIGFSPVAIPSTGVDTLALNGASRIAPSYVGSFSNLDDAEWDNQALPFNFNFFGVNYTSFSVSTNGFISFGSGRESCNHLCFNNQFPSSTSGNPIAAAVYSDLFFSNQGTISYFTSGTAPNRKLVINWLGGEYFNYCFIGCSGTGSVTAQMVLYEGNNNIDVYITNASGYNSEVEGLQNANATNVAIVPGRNDTAFTATNDGYRFSPSQYQWQYKNGNNWNNVTSGTPTGANYSGAQADHLIISGISIPNTYNYRCYTVGNSFCGTDTSTPVTVTVVGQATATTPSLSNSSICTSGTIVISEVPSSFGTGIVNYQWQYDSASVWKNVANNLPTGAYYNNQTTNVLTGTFSTSGVNQYRCQITPGGSGCLSVNSNQVVVSVVPEATATNPTITNSVICTGGTAIITESPGNQGTGTLSYHWQFYDGTNWDTITNGSGNLPVGSIYSNATTNSLSVSGIANSANYQFRSIISPSGNGCTSVSSGPATLSVVSQPAVTVQPTNPAPTCTGGASVINVSGTCAIPVTYLWQYSPNGLTWNTIATNSPSGAIYGSHTIDSLNISGINAPNNYYYRCQVSASGNGCGVANSDSAVLVVVPQAQPATPIVTNQTICVGGATTFFDTLASGGSGIISYQWQYYNGATWVNISNGTPAGAIYQNQNTDSLSVSNLNGTGIPQYQCLITPSANGCTPQASPIAAVNVLADPIVSTPSYTNPTICTNGANSGIVTVTGGNGTPNFQWQYSANGVAGWVPVVNGLTGPGGTTMYSGATSYQLQVSGDTLVSSPSYRCIVIQSTSGCADTSASKSFNIVNGPSLSAPTFASICAGSTGTSSAVVHANGGGGINSFQWQYYDSSTLTWQAANNNIPIGALYTGLTDSIITISHMLNPGIYQYQCVLTQSGASCAANSPSANLIVANVLGFSQLPMDTSVCLGFNSASFSVTAVGGAPTVSYQWQVNNGNWINVVNGIPSGSIYSGDTLSHLQISGPIADSIYNYRCVISARGSGCSPALPSQSCKLIVLKDPQITSPNTPSAICKDGNVSLTLTAQGGVNVLNYHWQYLTGGTWQPVTNGIPNGTHYFGANSPSIAIDTIDTVGTFQYRCLIDSSGNGCNSRLSSQVSVVVNPSPYFLGDPTAPVEPVCSGSSAILTVSVDTTSPNIHYKWLFVNANGIWQPVSSGIPLGVSYSGIDSASLHITGLNNFNLTPDTLIFACQIYSPGISCKWDTSSNAYVIVKADINLSRRIGADTICAGGNATLVAHAVGGNAPYTYNWQWNNGNGFQSLTDSVGPNGVTYPGLTDTSTILRAQFASNVNQVVNYYRCLISSPGAGCNTYTSDTAKILVVNSPGPQSSGYDTICAGGAVSFNLNLTSNTPQVHYLWQYDTSSLVNGTPHGVTYVGSNAKNLVINTDAAQTSPGSYNYQYVVTAPFSGCVPLTGQFQLQVNAGISLHYNFDPNPRKVCVGGSAPLADTAFGGTGKYVYAWEYATPDSNSTATIVGGGQNYTALQAGFWRSTVRDTISAEGCKTVSTPWLNLLINSDPTIHLIGDTQQTLCVGNTLTLTRTNAGGWSDIGFEQIILEDSIAGGSWSVLTTSPDSIFTENYTTPGTFYYREVFACIDPTTAHCLSDTSNVISRLALSSPSAPIIDSSLASGICVGSSNVSFQVTNPNSNYQYAWSMLSSGDSIFTWDNNTRAHISFTGAGMRTLQVISSINSGLCTDTTFMQLNVNPALAPANLNIVITQPGNNLFCTNTSFANYQWGYDLNNGTEQEIISANSPLYESNDSLDLLNRAYWVRVCSAEGCCTKVYFNNPTLLNIQNGTKNFFKVSPNPTFDYINLSNIDVSINRIEIFSADGKRLNQFYISRGINYFAINLAEYTEGMYFIAAYNDNIRLGTTKIITIK